MSDSPTRDAFDALASDYDALKLRVIPGYREIQALVDRYAGIPDQPATRVLELGLGTGHWAEQFLASHSQVEYHGIEFSQKMRELAAARLRRFQRRVHLYDLDLNEGLPRGSFDLVASFFAIHHVRDKARLLRDVFGRLAPGGRLLYADITSAPTPALEQLQLDGWADFMRNAGLEEERIPHVLRDHRENDLPETTQRQLTYMHEVGLDGVSVLWSQEKFVLFFGQKRGGSRAAG
jgi:putative AdoMet-dependent methyltransferase